MRHGMSGTPEYKAWAAMKDRCNNPNSTGYRFYGGRGIKVCSEWLNNSAAFLADMGPRPTDQHSLDRIDVNGNYEPNNCRWATREQQARNRQIPYLGETKNLSVTLIKRLGGRAALAEHFGLTPKAVEQWEKRNRIPGLHHLALLEYAADRDIKLTAAELMRASRPNSQHQAQA